LRTSPLRATRRTPQARGAAIASLCSSRPSGRQVVLRTKLLRANPSPRIAGLQPRSGQVNYLIGSDASRWRTHISTYARVRYEAVYPGVDLVYYGNQQRLEYDFEAAPGADPAAIRLGFEGADRVALDRR